MEGLTEFLFACLLQNLNISKFCSGISPKAHEEKEIFYRRLQGIYEKL